MAKNDKKKMQDVATKQTATAQAGQDNTMNQIGQTQNRFNDTYDKAVPMQMDDYRSIMDQYKSYASGPQKDIGMVGAERVNYNRSAEMDKAMKGYSGFADNGGFSGDDLTNMRSRALSPVSSVYNNMQNEMSRQKNIQGGYSPNFNAASAKMRSGTSQQMSDVLQQVNGEIARMTQQGKLSGLQGLGGLANADTGFDQNAQMANQSAGLQAGLANQRAGMYDPRLQAINAQAGMFGQTPGFSNFAAQNILGNQSQMLQGNQNQQGVGGMALQGQQMANDTKSNFETAMGRVGQVGQMAGQFAAPFMNPVQDLMPKGLPGMQGMPQGNVPRPIQQAYGSINYGNASPMRF